MGKTFVTTTTGQRIIQQKRERPQAEVARAAQSLEAAELRLNRFEQFLEAMDASEQERLLGIFTELEETPGSADEVI
jgi:hypothetical protein